MVTVSWIFPLQKIYMRLLLVQLCLKKKICGCQAWTPTVTAKFAEIKERKTNYKST